MTARTYCTATSVIFLGVASAHLIRAVLGWDVIIDGFAIPVWMSWVAAAGAGTLSWLGFSRRT